MKISKTITILLFLLLPACSEFYSRSPSAPTAFPSPTLTISSPTPISTTMTTSAFPNETCEPQTIPRESGISQNGEWMAVDCDSTRSEVSTYLHVFNSHSSQNWKINYSAHEPDILFEIDGSLSAFHWVKNGDSLYFENHEPIDDGTGHPMGNVFQIDLITGQVHDIFNDFNEISYTFSPDDRYLLYITPHINSKKVYVLDLSTQKIKTIELNEEYSYSSPWGLWASDNENFILSLGNTNQLHSLVLINVTKLVQTTFVSDTSYILYPIKWRNESEVILSDSIFYERFPESKLWSLDINTGKMSRIE